MHEKIRDIQNSLWKAYIDFRETKNMSQYNTDIQEIVEKYRFDPLMLRFCQDIILAWAPIINGMKEWS